MAFMVFRGGSRTAGTSKMERFVITVNGWKPLTIITKRSILDVAAVLNLPLVFYFDNPFIDQSSSFNVFLSCLYQMFDFTMTWGSLDNTKTTILVHQLNFKHHTFP